MEIEVRHLILTFMGNWQFLRVQSHRYELSSLSWQEYLQVSCLDALCQLNAGNSSHIQYYRRFSLFDLYSNLFCEGLSLEFFLNLSQRTPWQWTNSEMNSHLSWLNPHGGWSHHIALQSDFFPFRSNDALSGFLQWPI